MRDLLPSAWLDHLENIGPFEVVLPTDPASELLRLTVPHEDVGGVLASVPQRATETWWLLERRVHSLVSTMGRRTPTSSGSSAASGRRTRPTTTAASSRSSSGPTSPNCPAEPPWNARSTITSVRAAPGTVRQAGCPSTNLDDEQPRCPDARPRRPAQKTPRAASHHGEHRSGADCPLPHDSGRLRGGRHTTRAVSPSLLTRTTPPCRGAGSYSPRRGFRTPGGRTLASSSTDGTVRPMVTASTPPADGWHQGVLRCPTRSRLT